MPKKISSKGGAIDFEKLLRDTGKYIQPVADAAQDRAIKEIKGNGMENLFRDAGKYLQPVADAAQDRAMKEIRGSGARFTKKQLLDIILHKNKVIEGLEHNAYTKGKGFEDVMRDAGRYLQPTADAAQDRAIKEIKGSGRRLIKGSQEAKDKMARVRAMKMKK
jgi:hypothetical protein